MWKLDDRFWELLRECLEMLAERLLFSQATPTPRLPPTVVANLLHAPRGRRGGAITIG